MYFPSIHGDDGDETWSNQTNFRQQEEEEEEAVEEENVKLWPDTRVVVVMVVGPEYRPPEAFSPPAAVGETRWSYAMPPRDGRDVGRPATAY